jgi:hypothetical protein
MYGIAEISGRFVGCTGHLLLYGDGPSGGLGSNNSSVTRILDDVQFLVLRHLVNLKLSIVDSVQNEF